MPTVQGGRAFQDRSAENKVAIVRINHSYGFAFSVGVRNEYPMAEVTVRFTDDVGLHWQLDQAALKKLDETQRLVIT